MVVDSIVINDEQVSHQARIICEEAKNKLIRTSNSKVVEEIRKALRNRMTGNGREFLDGTG